MMNEQDGRTGYAEDVNGNVVLTMTKADYSRLVHAMGYYIGGTEEDRTRAARSKLFAWANRINAGNRHWAPYAEPTEGYQ
jgi:hypothetical protein